MQVAIVALVAAGLFSTNVSWADSLLAEQGEPGGAKPQSAAQVFHAASGDGADEPLTSGEIVEVAGGGEAEPDTSQADSDSTAAEAVALELDSELPNEERGEPVAEEAADAATGESASSSPEATPAQDDADAMDETDDESTIQPMAEGADGGDPPYVYWTVQDTQGNLVPGATFRFERRFQDSRGRWVWVAGNGATALADCEASPNSCGNSSLDRDTDGGEFLLPHFQTPGSSFNRVAAGNNYRVSQGASPAGYDWAVPGTNTQTIGATNGNNATWNNGDGSGTHNFGAFQVVKRQTLPLCEPGYVYALGQTGQLQQIDPSGNVTPIGAAASGVTSFNGLGIGSGGNSVYAYERSGTSVSELTIWKYDIATGVWTSTGTPVNSNTSSRAVLFIAGAVNYDNGRFFVGGFDSDGGLFRLWEYNPATGTTAYKGHINTPGGATGQQATNNGDIAFDAAGNLFVVRGTGNTTTVFSITKVDLEAASGGSTAIPSSQSASVTTMDNVNGVAFDATGKAYLGAASELRSYDMPDWSGRKDVTSNLGTSGDLASCSSPPTIVIEKEVIGGRVNPTDQFKLTLNQGSGLLGDATTSGSAIGVQAQRIGPLPTARGVRLDFAEAGAGTANLGNYASAYQCTVTHRDGSLENLEQVSSTSGSITIPPTGEAVKCVFRNSPLIANVNIHKDVVNTEGEKEARQGWTVGTRITAGSATLNPAGTAQATNASGDAAWELRFNNASGRATVDVWEQMQTGYEFVSASCGITSLNGSQRTITLDSTDPQALDNIAPGDRVDCTYTNAEKQNPGSATWSKVDDQQPANLLGGSEWTITGPGHSEGTVITDCTSEPCEGSLDKDPEPGEFRLEGLVWGQYTVTETSAPVGYVLDPTPHTFTFTVNKDTVATAITPKGSPFVNVPAVGSVRWTKVDSENEQQLLAGSKWEMTGPGEDGPVIEVEDCVVDEGAECSGHDLDPAVGKFLIEGLSIGEYVLTETIAPSGYAPLGESLTFTVGVGEGASLEVELPPVKNVRVLGSVTWTKVAAGNTATRLAGSVWELTLPDDSTIPVEDCVADAAEECAAMHDKDPSAGGFRLDGLVVGEYVLTETSAPVGYVVDSTPHAFSITVEEPNHAFGQPFENKQRDAPVMPLTGGMGAVIFLAIGGGLLAGAMALGIGAKRRRATA